MELKFGGIYYDTARVDVKECLGARVLLGRLLILHGKSNVFRYSATTSFGYKLSISR